MNRREFLAVVPFLVILPALLANVRSSRGVRFQDLRVGQFFEFAGKVHIKTFDRHVGRSPLGHPVGVCNAVERDTPLIVSSWFGPECVVKPAA